MVVLFHRWYIVLHLIGCGRSGMKILFAVFLFLLCGGCRGYDCNVPYIERYTYTIDIWLLLSWIGMISRLE